MKTNEKGITLAVLVITVIVMTLMAGVTIGAANSNSHITNIARNRTDTFQREVNQHSKDINTLTDRVND